MNDEVKKWAAIIFALLCLAFLALILSGGANKEVAWFIVPIGGLYRMIGGTWNKAVGRFLTPALPVVPILLLGGWSFWLLLIYGVYLLAKTLPFTLIGGSIHDSFINWPWIWVLGFINGLCAMSLLPIVGMGEWLDPILYAVGFPMLAYGICGTLSNIKATAKYFPWKFCEFIRGASAMIPPALLIDHFYGGII